MNTHVNDSTNTLIVAVLGLMAGGIIVLTLLNKPIPFISNDRAAFVVLAVIGLGMCAVGGIGPAITNYGWAHPLTIFGSIVGVLILFLSLKVFVGFSIPVITTDHDAIIALAILGLVKVVANLVYPLMSR
jgi:hypothetical protein